MPSALTHNEGPRLCPYPSLVRSLAIWLCTIRWYSSPLRLFWFGGLVGSTKLEIIPLGGLGEFGMNITAIRYGEDMILVDAGMAFPDDSLLGVDIIVPDMTFINDNRHQLLAIVLTHLHEDHIGALPY